MLGVYKVSGNFSKNSTRRKKRRKKNNYLLQFCCCFFRNDSPAFVWSWFGFSDDKVSSGFGDKSIFVCLKFLLCFYVIKFLCLWHRVHLCFFNSLKENDEYSWSANISNEVRNALWIFDSKCMHINYSAKVIPNIRRLITFAISRR